jgi:hypothetical protein
MNWDCKATENRPAIFEQNGRMENGSSDYLSTTNRPPQTNNVLCPILPFGR